MTNCNMTTTYRTISVLFGVALALGAIFTALPASAALDFPSVADLEEGDLFKTADSSTVYYFGQDERRYGFPNENTYFTWFEDFNDIATVTNEEMNLIPFGGMVTYFPHFNGLQETRLLQIAGHEHLYVSIGDGVLVGIKDETAAVQHFGSHWSDRVDALPDAFVPHYTVTGTVIDKHSQFDQFIDSYTISDDKGLAASTGIMIYTDPLRFAATEEGSDCGEDYCAYNEATITSGDTIKFVNYSDETVSVREENNRWTTGPMSAGDIVVLKIDVDPGTYSFYGNGDLDFIGELTVE